MGWDAAISLYQENLPKQMCPSGRLFATILQCLSETGSLKSKEYTDSDRPRFTRTITHYNLEHLVFYEISQHRKKSMWELSLQFNDNQYSI